MKVMYWRQTQVLVSVYQSGVYVIHNQKFSHLSATMCILHHELRNNSVFFKQKTETSLILDTNFTFLRHFNLCFVDIASTNLQYSVVCSYKMQSYIFNTVLQYFSLRLSYDPFKMLNAVSWLYWLLKNKYQSDGIVVLNTISET